MRFYPAETLYEVVICLQMYLNSRGINVKLLDDPDYVEVRNCLDNPMKELSRAGNVAQRRKADVITLADENLMWARKCSWFVYPQTISSYCSVHVWCTFRSTCKC